jgi:hypothetical protein
MSSYSVLGAICYDPIFVMTERFNRQFRFVMTRYFRIRVKKETIKAKIGADQSRKWVQTRIFVCRTVTVNFCSDEFCPCLDAEGSPVGPLSAVVAEGHWLP